MGGHRRGRFAVESRECDAGRQVEDFRLGKPFFERSGGTAAAREAVGEARMVTRDAMGEHCAHDVGHAIRNEARPFSAMRLLHGPIDQAALKAWLGLAEIVQQAGQEPDVGRSERGSVTSGQFSNRIQVIFQRLPVVSVHAPGGMGIELNRHEDGVMKALTSNAILRLYA